MTSFAEIFFYFLCTTSLGFFKRFLRNPLVITIDLVLALTFILSLLINLCLVVHHHLLGLDLSLACLGEGLELFFGLHQ
jgi:hypothetical protein